MTMEFGVTVGNFGQYGKRGTARDQVLIAQKAEELGFDSVWVHDHLFMPATIRARYPYNEQGSAGFAYRQDIYDPLAMMAAIAVSTARISIGTSVLIIPYRNPVVLARMLATLDHLSRGRILLGLGVGWMAEEFDALGIGSHYARRGSVTDEWMRICMALWTGERTASHHGNIHSFDGLATRPRPVQRPHIPLWVGGKGEIAARRVARYGSGYHTITSTPEQIEAELRIVRAEVEKAGRDPAEIVVSMLGPAVMIGRTPPPGTAAVGGSAAQIVEGLREYERAGLQHAIVLPSLPNTVEPSPAHTTEAMQFLAAEVLPAFR
jgi:probable F420-dependent oxidoreductase